MAKTIKILLIISICLVVPRFASRSQAINGSIEQRKAWFNTAQKYVGIKERTNRNDHDSIALFNRFSKVAINSPYCAAGLYYTSHRAGLRFKIKFPAGVKFWFTPRSTIYNRQTQSFITTPQFMDVVWVYSSHIEAIAQPTIRRDMEDEDKFITIGFNTGSGTGKQGVYYPLERRWRDVRKIANPFLLQ